MSDNELVRSRFLVELMRAAVGLPKGEDRLPTFAEVGDAAKGALARAVFRVADGNVTRAAAMMGTSRPTLHRILTECPPPDDSWHDPVMHEPFDDALFPFVRVLWPSEPSEDWAKQYADWLIDAIIPRVQETGLQVVNLENWSTMVALPPISTLNRIKYLIDTTVPKAPNGAADAVSAGAVFYAPNVPIAGFLAPIVNNVSPVPVRIATSTDKVKTHATALFRRKGVPVPSNLTLD